MSTFQLVILVVLVYVGFAGLLYFVKQRLSSDMKVVKIFLFTILCSFLVGTSVLMYVISRL